MYRTNKSQVHRKSKSEFTLKNLLKEPPKTAKQKLVARLEELNKIHPSNIHIKLPKSFSVFMTQCEEWLNKLISSSDLSENLVNK